MFNKKQLFLNQWIIKLLPVLIISLTFLYCQAQSTIAISQNKDEENNNTTEEISFYDKAGNINIPAINAALDSDVRAYMAHLTTLANPFFEGRAPGTNGIKVAADYIEFWFKGYGLKPAFPESSSDDSKARQDPATWNSYRQPFGLPGGKKTTKQELSLHAGNNINKKYTAAKDFNALGMGSSGQITAPLSFVGYGITEGPGEFSSYNSFGDIDLTNRIAILLRFEPSNSEDGLSKWRNGRQGWSGKSGLTDKMRNVTKKGAAGIILVCPPDTHDDRSKELMTAANSNYGNITVPIVQMSLAAADELLQTIDGRTLKEFKALADADDATSLHFDDEFKITIDTKIEKTEVMTENVGAYLPGKGNLADQWVIIGGHYDHVGYSGSVGNISSINPGADDNASGTTGVLLAATRLKKVYDDLPGNTNARSILFLTFTAEERGLIGSAYFANNPTIDLQKVTAMINLDMIGRLREGKLDVGGVGTAENFLDFLNPHFDKSGLTVTTQNSGQGPSDHSSFYAKNIPVLFMFSGFHPDYHSPSDVASKINPVGAVQVVNMVQNIAMDMATRNEQLTFKKSGGNWRQSNVVASQTEGEAAAEEQTTTITPSRSNIQVRIGIRPASYGDDEGGIELDSVSPGSPAEKGGLKSGDVITKWNDVDITGMRAMMVEMMKHKPGDKVKITVIRDGKPKVLTIELEGIETDEGG